MSKRLTNICLNTVKTLAAPVIVFFLIMLISNIAGNTGFGTVSDLRNIFLNTTYTGLIALAVSYNLTSGRFDFSLGSVLVLTVILSGMLVKSYDIGPIGMLATALLSGAVLSGLSGLVYVWLRLPPMVVSLGIAMIYEALAFTISDGVGVKLMLRFDILIFATQPVTTIVLVAVLAVLIYLLNFTKFGYNTNSLRSGQKISVDVGINEKRNTVACYVLAGCLTGVAGMIYISQYGTMAPSTGLSSMSYIMSAFLPMFIGTALQKYTDRNVGIIIGAFIQACITSGFNKFAIGSSVQTVLNGIIVLAFLIYASNQYKIIEFKMFSEKKARALTEKVVAE